MIDCYDSIVSWNCFFWRIRFSKPEQMFDMGGTRKIVLRFEMTFQLHEILAMIGMCRFRKKGKKKHFCALIGSDNIWYFDF